MNQINTQVLAQKITSFRRSLAVVIGINEYHNNIPKLRTARRDAEVLAQILAEEHQYDEVILITDETKYKPTLKNLLTLLEERLPKEIRLTKDDRLLFYFAGHGIARDSDKGPAGNLVPQDADLENNKTLLPMQKLHECLSALSCRHLLVILDCCFAGTFRWSSARLATVIPKVIRKEHYDRFIKSPAWQAITSAAHNQEALDILHDNRGGNKHSPFAEALFKALRGEGDIIPAAKNGKSAGDGVISATELYLYLRDHVETASNESQTPGIWTLSKHDRGEYIFLVPGADPKLKPAPKLTQKNNPYRGLQSFEEEHSHLFFGRKELIEELYKKVSYASSSLTVVSGISGSGKSSLVKAGLIPEVRQNHSQKWYILKPMRPSESPFTALAKTLLLITNNNDIVVSQQLDNLHFIEKIIQQEITALNQRIDDCDINSESDEIIRLEQEVNNSQRIVDIWKRGTKETKQRLVVNYFDELNNLCHDKNEQKLLQEVVLNCLNPLSLRLHDPNEFIKIVKAWSQQRPGMRLLLVIDQFEELITLSSQSKEDQQNKQPNLTESQQFLKLLEATLAANLRQLSIVVTLRSDFEPRFLNSEALKSYWTSARFPVRAMHSDELREAIERPAAEMALYFEQLPGERNPVDKLVDEVGQMPGALPLLSFTLSELYIKLAKKWVEGKSSDRALTLDAEFDKEGGVTGSLTGRANKEYDELPDDAHRVTMRRVMLRMVTIGGGESARRRVPLSELVYVDEAENKRIEEVIKRLDKARLIVSGQETGKPYVEPAHDFLVRSWDKLQTWQQEEQENLSLQRRLTPAAEEWKNIKDQEKQPNLLAKTWEQAESVAIGKIQTWRRNWQRRKQEETNISRGSSVKSIAYLWDDDPRLEQLNQVLDAKDSWFNWIEDNFVRRSVLQRSKNTYRFRVIVTVVILALSGLTLWALNNLRLSTINAMLANTEAADGNLRSNQLILNALTNSLSAGESLKNQWLLKIFPPKKEEQIQVITTLRKAVYTVKEYYKYEGFPSGVKDIFLHENGKLLVVSTENDGTVRVWDKQAKKLAELPGNQYSVTQVIVSPDGSKIAIGTNRGSILLWNWQNQQQATVLQRHQCQNTDNIPNSCEIKSLTFNQGGTQLVSVAEDGIARLWSLFNDRYREREIQVPQNKIIAAGFDRNGQLLLVTKTETLDKKIAVLNSSFRELGETDDSFSTSGGIDDVILSSNGEEIAIIYGSSRSTRGVAISLWNRQQNHLEPLPGQNGYINFSRDGNKLATTRFNDGTVYLWDSDAKGIDELKGYKGQIASVNFRSDGKVLATASADGTLHLWTLQQQQPNQLQELPDKVNSLTFSEDGKLIATQAVDGTLRLLDLSGRLVKQFNNQFPVFNSLRFSPDGKQLATLKEGTVGILDLSSQKYREFAGKYGSVETNLSFSPNGKQIALRGEDDKYHEKIYLLDVSSGKPDHSFPDEENRSSSNVIWKSDDQILLAAKEVTPRSYTSIVLLDVKSGKQLQTIPSGLQHNISGMSFNNDGSLAALVEEDGTVSLWYLDGTKIAEFKDPEHNIKSVVLSPDSSTLATIGEDGTAKLWEIGKLPHKQSLPIRQKHQSNTNQSLDPKEPYPYEFIVHQKLNAECAISSRQSPTV